MAMDVKFLTKEGLQHLIEKIKSTASLEIGTTPNTAGRGDWTKAAFEHSESPHAPAEAEPNVQANWGEEDITSDAYILNKPTALPANGGTADSAGKLNTDAGSSGQPVYFKDGVPVECEDILSDEQYEELMSLLE